METTTRMTTWSAAAAEMIRLLDGDMRHGLMAKDGWQRAALSMSMAWYIRSWRRPGRARHKASQSATWITSASRMLTELKTRCRQQQDSGSWSQWAASRPQIGRRCEHD
jgi:hypothetical protein